MCSHTVDRGSGAWPRKKMTNMCDLVQSGRPKFPYYQPKKSTILRIINQQQNVIAIFLSLINVDDHVSMKVNKYIS